MSASYFCYTVIPLTSTHFPYGKLRQRVMLSGRELWTSRHILNVTPSPRSWCRPFPNPCFSHFTQEEDIICCHSRMLAYLSHDVHCMFPIIWSKYIPSAQTKVGSAWDRDQYQCLPPWHSHCKKQNASILVGIKVFSLSRWRMPQIHIYEFVTNFPPILFSQVSQCEHWHLQTKWKFY